MATRITSVDVYEQAETLDRLCNISISGKAQTEIKPTEMPSNASYKFDEEELDSTLLAELYRERVSWIS